MVKVTVKVGEIACFAVVKDAAVIKEKGSLLLNLVHYSDNVCACLPYRCYVHARDEDLQLLNHRYQSDSYWARVQNSY